MKQARVKPGLSKHPVLAGSLATLIALAACESAASPLATGGRASASVPPRPSVGVAVLPETPGPIRPPGVASNAQPLLFGCTDGLPRCTGIAPGTYYTAGEWAFLPGLTFTLPAGWSSLANEAGELELHLDGDDHNEILIWRDVVPWEAGHAALALQLDPDGWAARLRADSCLAVTEPERLALGTWIDLRDSKVVDLQAVSASVGPSSDTAAYAAAGCPDTGVVDIFVDPIHWANSPFSVGGDETVPSDASCPCKAVQRLYFASIGYVQHHHLLVVALQSYGPAVSRDAEMARLQAAAQPILDSLIAPAIVVDN